MGIWQTEHAGEFSVYFSVDVYTSWKTAMQRDSMATEGEHKVHLAESKMNSCLSIPKRRVRQHSRNCNTHSSGKSEMLKGFTIILELTIRQLWLLTLTEHHH